MDIREYILNFIFTNTCVACGKLLAINDPNDVCEDCKKELQKNIMNARIGINDINISYDKFLFRYSYKVARAMVLEMKYVFRFKNCRYFGDVATECIKNDADFPDFDIITHCPRKPSKKRYVGYDQAQQVAQNIAKNLDKPYMELLKRHEGGREQKKVKKLKDRVKNIHGKFYLNQKIDFRHKRILLVDDIITSGATVCECARILKKGGASDIIALFILD